MSQRHIEPDEILERLEELEDTQDDHQKRWDATDSWKNHVGYQFEDLEEQVDELEQRVDELEAMNAALRDIGTEKTSKEQKIAGIVAYAENKADDPTTDAVTVLPRIIKNTVGVSRRYAYTLVDDMVNGDGPEGVVGEDGYGWAFDPSERPQRVDKDTPQKGVLVDFERLHDDPEAVNKFTTGGG